MSLGLVASWQFSTDPGVNIKLNNHVVYPEGWTQSTVQPVGPAYAAARIANPMLTGLGMMLPSTRSVFCDQSCGCAPQNPCCCGESAFNKIGRAFARPKMGMRGLGLPIARTLGDIDSWAYRNRMALVLGGLGLVAAAGLGVGVKLLRKR